MAALEILVAPHDNDDGLYRADHADGTELLTGVPELMLDLIPFMLARRLLEWRYDPECLLVVKLQGADFEMMRAPLGVVAAKPLLNTANPVTQPTYNAAWTELRQSSS